jgi:hypothetical protein
MLAAKAEKEAAGPSTTINAKVLIHTLQAVAASSPYYPFFGQLKRFREAVDGVDDNKKTDDADETNAEKQDGKKGHLFGTYVLKIRTNLIKENPALKAVSIRPPVRLFLNDIIIEGIRNICNSAKLIMTWATVRTFNDDHIVLIARDWLSAAQVVDAATIEEMVADIKKVVAAEKKKNADKKDKKLDDSDA